MSDSFDVFDTFGNKLGEFTPSGGGGEGCLFVIVVMLVGVLVATVYTILKAMWALTIAGFGALREGKMFKALFSFSALATIIMIPVIFVGALVVGSVISANAQHQKEVKSQAEDQQAQQTAQALEQNPPIDVIATKGSCPSGMDCGGPGPYILITIANHWKGSITLSEAISAFGDVYCVHPTQYYDESQIQSGETMEFYCIGGGFTSIQPIKNACLNFSYDVSSYDPLYKYHPTTKICVNIK